VLPADRVEALLGAARKLETVPDVAEVARLLGV